MSEDADTLPPDAESHQEQLELTTQLYDSDDPTARLVAHMSTRQLYIFEAISQANAKLDRLIEKDRAATVWRREISDRVEALENPPPRNGSSL